MLAYFDDKNNRKCYFFSFQMYLTHATRLTAHCITKFVKSNLQLICCYLFAALANSGWLSLSLIVDAQIDKKYTN